MSIAQLTDTAPDDRPDQDPPAPPDVEVVIPVYNEERQLADAVTALRHYLDSSFPLTAGITIADNASTDGTWAIAAGLADELPGVRALHLDRKGRGRALRAAWSASTADVVAYMDVDLATGLDALFPLVAPLLSGHSDVAIGTRLAPGAHVVRGARREFISRGYNMLLRAALRSTCTDAQCGFKAMRRDAATDLLPLIEDEEWFFDTEMLVTAQRLGLRIHEVPVDWVDDTDSRVAVVTTAVADLHGVWRMLRANSKERALLQTSRSTPELTRHRDRSARRVPSSLGEDASTSGQLATPESEPAVFADELLRFAGVGVLSTVAYAVLFAAFEPGLGSYAANTLSIILCSLGNTAAHRGMAGAARHHLDRAHRLSVAAGLLTVSLAATTAALATVRALGMESVLPELVAVATANAVAAVARFAILRTWVFRPQFSTAPGVRPGAPSVSPDAGRSSRRLMQR